MMPTITNHISGIVSRFAFLGALAPLFLLFLFAVPVGAQQKNVVRVAAEKIVAADTIALGDIAEITGERAERLAKIPLGYAPALGMTREIGREKIGLAIAAAGFAPADVSLVAPAKISVHREMRMLDQSAVRAVVEKTLLAQMQAEGVAARIVRFEAPADLKIPAGEPEIRALPPRIYNFSSAFPVSVEILSNGAVVRRASVTVQIEAEAEILVAVRDLARGEKITEADVRRETRRLEKPIAGYLRDAERLRGQVLVKNLPAGAALSTDTAAAGYVVRFGDRLRIVGQSGALQISVSGEARSSGRIGDRIAVKNLQSNAVLQATVLDEGLVRILF